MPTISNEHWINEPQHHSRDGKALLVTTDPNTDFWNNTFYDFTHANGHFHASDVSGDFTLVTRFSANYSALYDQAGAMVRIDANNWMKCGVEYTDGKKRFSVVVTRDDQSDWSVSPLAGALDKPVMLRISRFGKALRVDRRQGDGWIMVRLAFLDMGATVEVGPMCCSPTGGGLEVRFDRFEIGKPMPRELHVGD